MKWHQQLSSMIATPLKARALCKKHPQGTGSNNMNVSATCACPSGLCTQLPGARRAPAEQPIRCKTIQQYAVQQNNMSDRPTAVLSACSKTAAVQKKDPCNKPQTPKPGPNISSRAASTPAQPNQVLHTLCDNPTYQVQQVCQNCATRAVSPCTNTRRR